MAIRGLYVGRPAFSAGITGTIFLFRAFSKFWEHPLIDFFVNPYIVFVLFIIAGLVILYPYMHGIKTLILAPLLILMVVFFVYAYYLM